MRIPIEYNGVIPIYRQIESFLGEAIRSGNLAPGTRLPASRQLAEDLGVSRITVENAYAELKAEGLICSQTGSGTFVLPPCPSPPRIHCGNDTAWPLWQQEIPTCENNLHPQSPEEMLKAAGHPNPISLAGGGGDHRLFPVEDFRRTLQAVVSRAGFMAFGYGEQNGFAPLRMTIARVLTSQGLPVQPENVLITSGSQQALGLVSQLLLKSGDSILVESPTYAVALNLFRSLGLKIVGIPMDEQGMQVEKLEELLQHHRPKLIYTIPNFHNPTGTCMSSWRRRQLVAIADRYNVPILEDDYVGDLRYDGRAQPALKALDPGGRVIYISTFSKMLLPGLRVGFLVAEGPIYQALVSRKYVHDLASSNLMQHILEEYVTVGRYQTHLRRSCQIYRKRRDIMLAAIQRDLPKEIKLTPPSGGLFIWLGLPPEIDAIKLLTVACEQGVAFYPGTNFFPNPAEGQGYIRLNFTSLLPEEIEEGVRRLGLAFQGVTKCSV